MGFVGELIDKNKAVELVREYNLASPWPGRNEDIADNMIAWAYDKDSDAICLSVRSHQGLFFEWAQGDGCNTQSKCFNLAGSKNTS